MAVVELMSHYPRPSACWAARLSAAGSAVLPHNGASLAVAAYEKAYRLVGRLKEDTLDVHGVGTSPAWRELVESSARSAGLTLREHQGGFGPSDHGSFYAAGKPVLFFFTGSHSDYHKATDTADKVDAKGIVCSNPSFGAWRRRVLWYPSST